MLSELWLEVIKFLNCDEIINLSLTNKYFNNLLKENDCYLTRKFRGFPRHACSRIYRYEAIDDVTELIAHFNEKSIVRGDLICFSNITATIGIYIFDGHHIIELNNKTLPNKFKVINDNIPLDYWRHFDIRNVIWFDCSSVRQQCIDNTRYCNNLILTSFYYNGKKYEIKYASFKYGGVCVTSEESISVFQTIFINNDILRLRLSCNIAFEEYILFLYQDDYLQ